MAYQNLVITRAGPQSLHKSWLCTYQHRNFDVLVAAYDRAAMARDEAGLEHILIPGPKVRGWHQLFQLRPDLVRRYRSIALIDDDIKTKPGDVIRCFDYGADLELSIWQPSLTWTATSHLASH